MTDPELIQAIIKNKDAGFRALVDKYQDLVFRTCFSFIKNIEDAEDITQEVFIKVYQKIEHFRGDSSISTWLYRIAVNKSLNFLRDNKYHRLYERIETFFSGELDHTFEIPSNERNPENLLLLNETEEMLNKALMALSKNQRTAFVLDKYNELSYREIADVMKTTVSSVQSLIHRAKLGLQKKLYHYYQKNASTVK